MFWSVLTPKHLETLGQSNNFFQLKFANQEPTNKPNLLMVLPRGGSLNVVSSTAVQEQRNLDAANSTTKPLTCSYPLLKGHKKMQCIKLQCPSPSHSSKLNCRDHMLRSSQTLTHVNLHYSPACSQQAS